MVGESSRGSSCWGGGGGWRGDISVEGSRKGKTQERNTTKIILVPLVRTLEFMSEAAPALPGTFPSPCGVTGLAAQVSFRARLRALLLPGESVARVQHGLQVNTLKLGFFL